MTLQEAKRRLRNGGAVPDRALFQEAYEACLREDHPGWEIRELTESGGRSQVPDHIYRMLSESSGRPVSSLKDDPDESNYAKADPQSALKLVADALLSS